MSKVLFKPLLAILLIVASLPEAGARNILNCRYGSIEAPEGISYNRALSAKSQLEVYSSSDSKSAFAFGSEPNDKGLAAGSIISMMANFMGISGEISRIKGRGGVPVYAIINPENGRVFAMAGHRSDPEYTVIIMYGQTDKSSALEYLKTFQKKK